MLVLLKNLSIVINHQPMHYTTILNSGNIMYVCDSCKPNFSINNIIPPSQMNLSSISSKLDDIKEIVNNTYTNAIINN